MKHTRFFSALALLAISVVASAQPDPANAPKGDNPANRAVGGGARGGRLQNMQNLTPEQRTALIATALKRQLTTANVTNETQQDAVVTYVTGEMDAREKMTTSTTALQTGLRNAQVTDAQIAGLLNDYNAAASDDKVRHEKALATLKAAIDVTQFPRLEAMLTLSGLYGDAPVAGGNLMGMMGGGGGRGRIGVTMNGGAVGGNNTVLGGARGNMAGRRNQNVPF